MISSDPQQPRVRLTLSGTVVGVGSQPSKVISFYEIQGSPTSKEYTIYTVGDGPIKLKILSQPSFIDTKIEKLDGGPPAEKNNVWAQYKLVIALKADTPTGRLQGNMVVETTSQLTPKLEFRIIGQVRPGITVDPTTVRILVKDGKSVTNKTCKIKKHTEGLFKILKIQPSVKELVCQVKEITPGKIYQIDVEWAGPQITETRNEMITVETDAETQPIFTIPVVLSP